MDRTFDGIAEISVGLVVPYHYENGILRLFLGNVTHSLETGRDAVIGQKHDAFTGGYTLFHLTHPLENYGLLNLVGTNGAIRSEPVAMGTLNQNVDYYIDKYDDGASFTQMRFSFKELDFFLPSGSITAIDDMTGFIFSRQPVEVKRFAFVYQEKTVAFVLRTFSNISCGYKSHAETKSELILEFEKSTDVNFFISLFHLVYGFFSFICNRRNLTLSNVALVGQRIIKHPITANGKTTIGEKTVPTTQILVPIDNYRAGNESDKDIGRTLPYKFWESNLESLFMLFINDTVSISSLHESLAARRLIDLKQSLHITATFEYYQRKLLPDISSKETQEAYDAVKAKVDEYAAAQTGKKKKKAKEIAKFLTPPVSLSEKVIKVYAGYQEWLGVKPILMDWYGDNISDIAEVANEWRNELAHEKREIEPDERVVSAVRLIEHLNYCIVLRKAGYSDENIKAILEEILTR